MLDVQSLVNYSQQVSSQVDAGGDLESQLRKIVGDIQNKARKAQADYDEANAENRAVIRRLFDAKPAGPAPTPELNELSVLLWQNPAIVPAVLNYAKNLQSKLVTALQSQLAAAQAAT